MSSRRRLSIQKPESPLVHESSENERERSLSSFMNSQKMMSPPKLTIDPNMENKNIYEILWNQIVKMGPMYRRSLFNIRRISGQDRERLIRIQRFGNELKDLFWHGD